mmetsp:Transcript_1485/g.2223  ORF Transcript_1485/g.2223 Transcript_1485/m.2223 type:complete len:87 (+) Transcript_1485:57-317(+)
MDYLHGNFLLHFLSFSHIFNTCKEALQQNMINFSVQNATDMSCAEMLFSGLYLGLVNSMKLVIGYALKTSSFVAQCFFQMLCVMED